MPHREKEINVSRSNYSVIDSEFDNMRDRFENEMKRVEEEMGRLRREFEGTNSSRALEKKAARPNSLASGACDVRRRSKSIVEGRLFCLRGTPSLIPGAIPRRFLASRCAAAAAGAVDDAVAAIGGKRRFCSLFAASLCSLCRFAASLYSSVLRPARSPLALKKNQSVN